MRALVNGEELDLAKPTLAEVFSELGLQDLRGVAVAIDDQVVPRGSWDSIELRDGVRVEVLYAVQGG